jgi:ferrous iron transport protein B
MALLFKHTLFKGSAEHPFVMELPPYRLPTTRSVLIHMWHKAEHYLQKMGGVVLLFSVVLWWASNYPKAPDIVKEYDSKIEAVAAVKQLSDEERAIRIAGIETEKSSKLMEQSYIGRIGHIFEPLVHPFGTDWRGAVSLITGFVAKEVVVGSMGVLYSVDTEETEKSDALREKLKEQYTPLSAFSFMLFVLLYTPCIVAFVTIVRELNNWKWSAFSVSYQLLLALTSATVVFQIGKLLGLQ